MKHRKKSEQQHIRIQLDITRRKGPAEEPYVQSILYETDDTSESVASALRRINDEGNYKDMEGNPVGKIEWEHSCFQKKCGACAMVIDGRPGLACGTLLREHRGTQPMTIAPLTKFPVLKDLMTDRSILMENLKVFRMWGDEKSTLTEKKSLTAYEASRCLQCGCCLEVCPNFTPGESFFGAAAFVPAARLLSSMPKDERKRVRRAYEEHAYTGCGKSLACMDICPANIDIESLLIHSAAAVLFNR